MVNPNWPLTSCQVAFNAGVNTTVTPTWSDLTPRMWSLTCARGRQYELDQNQAGEGQLVFADHDELLNPGNYTSPYVAGNLLVNAGYDPAFDSYATATAPAWTTGVGVTPQVQAITPHSGTNSLGWTTSVSGTPQGMTFPVTCIIGATYTGSAWVRKGSGTDTMQISIAGGAAGTTLTANSTYTRLTVTFTATATSHTVRLLTTAGPTGAAAIAVDDLQLDYGTTAQPTTSAAWSTLVLPYRPILVQAMWPPTPVGGAVNLINLVSGFDPGFESYAAGATVPWILTTGAVIPTVTTSTPFEGTKSLTFAMAGNSTEQGVGLTLATIPGQQYTASLYVRQSAANTLQIFLNGGAGGTSTTTTGAYVRLTVTFTATQPTHQVWVVAFTPTLASTVNVDAIQVEPGGAASTYTNTGPTIYGVHRGFVERWPSTWKHQGMYGYAQVQTVDAFAALAARKLHTEVANSVLAKKPDYYWRLNEPQGARSFADTSGNSGPSLVMTSGKYGPATTFAAGTATNIPGDPSGTGILTDSTSVGFVNLPATVAQAGLDGTNTTGILLGSPTTPFGYTVMAWISRGTNSNDPGRRLLVLSPSLATFLLQVSSTIDFSYLNSTGISVADRWADSKPHLYVMTVSATSTTATAIAYVDGVQVGTDTSTTGPYSPATVAEIGGYIDPTTGLAIPGPLNGTYSHYALWNRVLSAAEVTDLYNAGKGYTGETSGQRIGRYLASNYNGTTALDAGQSTLGISLLQEDTVLLDACQGVALSENGNFWADGTGTLTFYSRTRRYLTTTAQWVFGENQPGGENPYEQDIAYDFDPQLVYNDVQVTNNGGVTAESTDDTSQANYGPRTYQRDISVASDNEAVDAANWILATHKDPHQRIAALTIKPSANPVLWPVALGAEIGDRVTVNRRTTAGFTMTADYFIEQISHAQKPDEWTVQFQMSPAFRTQVWLLGDATYGVLDSTTILGY